MCLRTNIQKILTKQALIIWPTNLQNLPSGFQQSTSASWLKENQYVKMNSYLTLRHSNTLPIIGKTPEDSQEKENTKIGKVTGHPKLEKMDEFKNQILMENRLTVICPIVKNDAKQGSAQSKCFAQLIHVANRTKLFLSFTVFAPPPLFKIFLGRAGHGGTHL